MDRRVRWLEFSTIYVVLPLVFFLFRDTLKHVALPLMIVLALVQWRILKRDESFDSSETWRLRNVPGHLTRILVFFVINAGILTLYTWSYHPDIFLGFPQQMPFLWLLVMLLYPVFSALPQEIVFRAWFEHRYRVLFKHDSLMLLASAVTFGLAHMFFGNWIAVLLSTVGGFIFMRTWLRSRSIVVTTLEHALWGDFLFTVGLGVFLFTGTVESTAAHGFVISVK